MSSSFHELLKAIKEQDVVKAKKLLNDAQKQSDDELKQLISMVDEKTGNNILLFTVDSNYTKLGDVTMAELLDALFSKILQVGGEEFFRAQLTHRNNAKENAMLLLCKHNYYGEQFWTVRTFVEMIIEVTDRDFLGEVFSGPCFLHCCTRATSSDVKKKTFVNTFVDYIAALLCFAGQFNKQFTTLTIQHKDLLWASGIGFEYKPDSKFLAETKARIKGRVDERKKKMRKMMWW